MQNLTLTQINEGALEELFQEDLKSVVANIANPNYPAEAKRTITLVIEFEPSANRRNTEISVSSKVKLATYEKHTSSALIQAEGLVSASVNQITLEEVMKNG